MITMPETKSFDCQPFLALLKSKIKVIHVLSLTSLLITVHLSLRLKNLKSLLRKYYRNKQMIDTNLNIKIADIKLRV